MPEIPDGAARESNVEFVTGWAAVSASFADMSPAEQSAYVAGMRAMARIISAGWDYHRKVESAIQIDGEFQSLIDEIVEQNLLNE